MTESTKPKCVQKFARAPEMNAAAERAGQEGAGHPASVGTAAAPPKQTSKIGHVTSLLQRPEGASLEELVTATGWQPHTTRAALTGLKKKGHSITKTKGDGAMRYAIAAEVRS